MRVSQRGSMLEKHYSVFSYSSASPRPAFADGCHLSKRRDAHQESPINSTSAVRGRAPSLFFVFFSSLFSMNELSECVSAGPSSCMGDFVCP